jgi:hypothetical protein
LDQVDFKLQFLDPKSAPDRNLLDTSMNLGEFLNLFNS